MRDLLRLAESCLTRSRGHRRAGHTSGHTQNRTLSSTLSSTLPRLFRVLPDNLERIGVVGTGGGERADARLLERVPTQVEGA